MKNALLIILMLIFVIQNELIGQENKVSLTAGYPINMTNHWLVGNWENPINFRFRYYHDKDLLTIGGGVNYSKYYISWFRYYNSDNNTISDLSPFLLIGLNLQKNIVTFKPNINLGYTFLPTDIEIYQGKNGAIYFASGIDLNFDLIKGLQIGLNASYNMTFTKLDFGTDDWIIQYDFIPIEDKIIKSLSVGLNLIFGF
ncbi:MAG: hypothetical protein JEZ09_05390 [Salinivirgaceae bacterium]|nr:hypothetical protein [Salinivirgaceae bacterium]